MCVCVCVCVCACACVCMYSIIHLLLYISLAGMYNAIHTFTFIHKPGRNIIPALSLKIKIRALEILYNKGR